MWKKSKDILINALGVAIGFAIRDGLHINEKISSSIVCFAVSAAIVAASMIVVNAIADRVENLLRRRKRERK